MSGAGASESRGLRWRLRMVAVLFLALGAASFGAHRAVAQGEPAAAPEVVPGDDGCFNDAASGQVAYCEGDVVDTPPDGGLIPGVDGCLYYPGGGLAECPGGAAPAFGGCIPMADGSPGCVIPGPVAGVSQQPDPSLSPDVADAHDVVGGVTVDPAPAPVIDASAIEPAPAVEQQGVPAPPIDLGVAAGGAAPVIETTVERPIAGGAVPEVSGIHPFLAAERVRVALAPVGAWIAALFGLIVDLM